MAFLAILLLATILVLSSSTSLTIVATLLLIRAAAVSAKEEEASSAAPLTYSPITIVYETSGHNTKSGITVVAAGHKVPSSATPSTQNRIVSDSSAGTFPSATTHTADTADTEDTSYTAATSMATGGTTDKDSIDQSETATIQTARGTPSPTKQQTFFEELRKLPFAQAVRDLDPVIESWKAEAADGLPRQPPTVPGSSRTPVCLHSFVEEEEDDQIRDSDFEDGLDVFDHAEAEPQPSGIAKGKGKEMEPFDNRKCLEGVPRFIGEGLTVEELRAEARQQMLLSWASWLVVDNTVEIRKESEESEESEENEVVGEDIQKLFDLEDW